MKLSLKMPIPLAFALIVLICIGPAANSQSNVFQLFASGGAYITKSNDKPAGVAHVVDNTQNGGANDDFAVFDFPTQRNLPANRVASTITISIETDAHGKYQRAGALDFYIGSDTSAGIGTADKGNHAWNAGPSGAKDNPVQVLPAEGLGLGSGLGIGSYFGTPDTFYPLGQAQWVTGDGATLQQFSFSIPYQAQAYINSILSSKGIIRIFIADDSHHTPDGDAEITIVPPWLTINTVPAKK